MRMIYPKSGIPLFISHIEGKLLDSKMKNGRMRRDDLGEREDEIARRMTSRGVLEPIPGDSSVLALA